MAMKRLGCSVILCVAACSSSSGSHDDGAAQSGGDQLNGSGDTAAIPDGMHALHVAIAGTGEVRFTSGDGASYSPCRTSCTVAVPDGTDVSLAFWTPSRFGGWSGDCTGTAGCAITMSGDHAVTATFAHDDREVATLLPARVVRGLAFAADGNLIVGDDTGVSERTVDGRVVWTTALDGGVHGLVTDAAGQIYGAAGSHDHRQVFALSATGALRWTRDLDVTFMVQDVPPAISTVQVSRDGHVVAVRTLEGLTVLDGNGAPRFQVAAQADGLAVAPDGTIALAVIPDRDATQLTLRRYAPDGTALPSLSPLPGDVQASLAYDASSNLAVLTNGGADAATGYVRADLTPAWTTRSPSDFTAGNQGVAFDAGGDVIAAYYEVAASPGALHLEQRRPGDGALAWSLRKAATDTLSGGESFLFALATDATGRVAVGGAYDFAPWIAVYQMPR